MGLESVPDKMLACQVLEFNKPYKIHEINTPKDLGPNDMLIKIAVASLCHTDFMVAEGIMGTKLPCTASHEGTGTVVAVGSDVKNFKEGDRVMNGIFRGLCGVCADCQGPENYKQYCGNNKGGIGVHIDGNFADYAVVDSQTTVKLPDKVSFEKAAPLACAGCTVWRGVLQTELKSGQWIAIVGSGGGLGHLGLQYAFETPQDQEMLCVLTFEARFAKALGLKVIAVDARDEGIALSKEFEPDLVVDARKGNEHVVSEVHKVTNGEGAAATVNVSDANSAAATACAITKVHGTVHQIAQPENVSIPFAEFVFRDIRIKGSLICSPDEARRMLELVAEHNIQVKTNAFNGLKEIPKLVEFAEGGKMQGKGIVLIDQKQIDEQHKRGA